MKTITELALQLQLEWDVSGVWDGSLYEEFFLVLLMRYLHEHELPLSVDVQNALSVISQGIEEQ